MLLELTRSIHGAWRIARMDPDALTFFDLTINGFWRSFMAIIVVAPFYVGFLILSFSHQPRLQLVDGPQTAIEWYLVVKLVTFAASWVIFPLVMVPISRLLDLTQTYVPYIIVWNWANVLEMAVILPAVMLFLSSTLPGQTGAIVLMVAHITMLFYGYLVARAGLQCKLVTGVGVVAFNFVLSLLFNGLASQML
ncbi:MAG: hypothetical protein HOK21_03335 [Rhodospirillaceae bacterium]|jgi:hypothetical protein|nr:hypothetical protein [Rhodospirillaceae bacterium]MBT4686691.1 hypothetical protein [Rhodospirillaceae bacterium]MBT5079505.1 hypothetical protein [Rhodospirillaceae bacterium]MBT5523094.1 hypothetical protein [Rhodospirillaceae bacterium]MBT5881494.1 hypothetical protein [Rhodospirillaceae bacterium]